MVFRRTKGRVDDCTTTEMEEPGSGTWDQEFCFGHNFQMFLRSSRGDTKWAVGCMSSEKRCWVY